jgi:hypothetical protein
MRYRYRDSFHVIQQLAPTFDAAADLPGTPDHLRGKRPSWRLRHRGFSDDQIFDTRREALRVGEHQQRLARLLGWNPDGLLDPRTFCVSFARASRSNRQRLKAAFDEVMASMA